MRVPESASFHVKLADWGRDEAAIADVRRSVFLDEQQVPEAMEWEGIDPRCDWFVARQAREGDTVIGIARLTPDGRIGRMAVVPAWRRRGVGSALLGMALQQARTRGFRRVTLHAQTHALPFYARFGFAPEGEGFMEAGIPHQAMYLILKEET